MQARFFQDGIQAQTVRKQCCCEFKSFTNLEFGNFKSQLAATERNAPKSGVHVQSCCFEYQTVDNFTVVTS